jgi:MOSC domain-containing protein YiiM
MKLLSIQVGLPREVRWQGQTVTSGIFKERVEGPVMLRTLNLDGDAQADLSVHGGPTRARLCLPSRALSTLEKRISRHGATTRSVRRKLTIEGLLETDVNIGDRFRIGTAEVLATAPRLVLLQARN